MSDPKAPLPLQGKETAMVKVRESEDLQRQLREAIKAKLAAGEIDMIAGEAEDGDDMDGGEFEPLEDTA